MKLQYIKNTELQVGDVAHAYGARFEITQVTEYEERDPQLIAAGLDKVVAAHARWLDGRIERGYFGPTKDWNFQGNAHASVAIEPRT